MGSYLSIVNDTPDPWQCKVGPDEAALKIAGIVIGAVGSLAAIIGTAGAAAPLAASLTANGVVSVFGVSTSALATATAGAAAISTYASVAGTVSGFGMSVAKITSDQLNKKGHRTIAPGQSSRWGKMSLSLWQQGTCVKTVIVNEKTVRVETLYMRPIFSGSTKNSNRDHKIQWWINKWGTEKQEIVAQPGKRRELEDDLDGTPSDIDTDYRPETSEDFSNEPESPEQEYPHAGDKMYFFDANQTSILSTKEK